MSFRLEAKAQETWEVPDPDSSQTWNFERAADGIVALRGGGLVRSSSKHSVPACSRAVLVVP